MTVISHDNSLNTTNLGLKSLAYKNKQEIEEIEGIVDYNKTQLNTISNYNTRVNNIAKNLQSAAIALIHLQKQLFTFRSWTRTTVESQYGIPGEV